MITYICMLAIIAFLGFAVFYKADLLDKNVGFFDITSTTALRGFWCIVIILVHVPNVYENKVQNMIGSFAYIGVTFFFMTSGYGLKLGVRKPDSINNFWKKRLPKLLFPMLWVNIVSFLSLGLITGKFSLNKLFIINGWVQWLLVCYFVFWIFYRFNLLKQYKDLGIAIVLSLFSFVIFMLGDKITVTTWTTEIYGFIWGLILANNKEKIENLLHNNWWFKAVTMIIMSAILGVLYLKYKYVFFIGGYVLKIFLGLLILTFMLQLITRLKIGNQIILFIGGVSYEIYLLHGLVFYIGEKICPTVDSGVFILISILITIFMSVVIHWLSENSRKIICNK